MKRGWRILIAACVGVAVLLAINVFITDGETKDAAVTTPGGELVSLPEGVVQVTEHGPRRGSPIVLLHCFTCAIDWWDRIVPLLSPHHRVIAIDLLGHGGSEKPASGYSMTNQARLVAGALVKLRVHKATVVGHSLGGIVATALAESSPRLVRRVVIIDQAPVNNGFGADLPFTDALTFTPVIGEALWRVMPNSAIEDGLGIAFAPGFDVPDPFVDDFRRLTYSAYDASPEAEDEYTESVPLDVRLSRARVPLLAIFGAEEQIYEPRAALRAYARVPGARTRLLAGAGHSPNVERPRATARLILEFTES
jgi:pimeloyl-ACP methyl ester carboxylesterase